MFQGSLTPFVTFSQELVQILNMPRVDFLLIALYCFVGLGRFGSFSRKNQNFYQKLRDHNWLFRNFAPLLSIKNVTG